MAADDLRVPLQSLSSAQWRLAVLSAAIPVRTTFLVCLFVCLMYVCMYVCMHALDRINVHISCIHSHGIVVMETFP